MSQELVISSNPIETTVAILEDDRLVEIYVEQHAQKALAGNIYKGRVIRVLAGMESAFVDIGLKRDAFLYVTDVLEPKDDGGEELDTDPISADPSRALAPAAPEDDQATEEVVDTPDEANGEPEQTAATPSDDDTEASAKRTSRRRGRRRRRSGRKDEKEPLAAESEAGAAPEAVADGDGSDVPDPAEDEEPVVLPGESLSKYGKASDAPAPAGPTESDSVDSARSATTQAAESSDSQAPEPDDADAGPGDSESGRNGDRPKGSVEVSPPSLLAELNIFGWLKKKDREPEAKEPAAKEPPAKEATAKEQSPKPSRRGRDRPRSGGRRRPEAGPSGEKRRDGSRRTGRRSTDRGGSREDRPRSGTKQTGSRRNGSQKRERPPVPQANIKDLLKAGQDVIVQVNKEPVGVKGARITAHVSLPGRFMVYMTTATHNGIAKKIQPESERSRLRKIVDRHSNGKPGGFVVRSAARGASEEELVADIEFLQKQWQGLQAKAGRRKAPAKLHSDLDIVERVLRDQSGQGFKTIWIDAEVEYERIMRFVERFHPELVPCVKLYTKSQPIFDSFGITKDLDRALKPKVWLKSGGYLVIDQTEALVAIDVNTGRYVGKSDRLEDTVLKTNLEAAEEIVRQLRLRDLGGIIVIDFIDMEDRKNRQQVHQVLQEALKRTRSPSRLLPFNDFGMVVITRKAVRQSLERAMCRPCPACAGSGKVKSSATVLSEAFSAANRLAAKNKHNRGEPARHVTLRVHPDIGKSLKQKSSRHIESLEEAVGTSVLVENDATMSPDEFTLG